MSTNAGYVNFQAILQLPLTFEGCYLTINTARGLVLTNTADRDERLSQLYPYGLNSSSKCVLFVVKRILEIIIAVCFSNSAILLKGCQEDVFYILILQP